jgi:hypothetical protein
MRKYVFRAVVLICMSAFAFGSQAATVMIDPATQESPPAGEMLTVDVKIEDVVGLFGYQFDLAFDNAALKFLSVEEGEFLKADGAGTFALFKPDTAADVNLAGVLGVGVARSGDVPGISGAGTLITITFEVLEAKASTLELQGVMLVGSDALELRSLLFSVDSNVQSYSDSLNADNVPVGLRQEFENNGFSLSENATISIGIIPPTKLGSEWRIIDQNTTYLVTKEQSKLNIYSLFNFENGVVEVPAGIKGDVDDDGAVNSKDAILALRIAVGLMTPTEDQMWAADMNDDGNIKSSDAILILRVAVGLAAPGVDTTADAGRQITVTLAEAHGVAGESITVPVSVDNAHVLAGGDISIGYDGTVLRAVDVSSDHNVLVASNLSEPGMVRIAFANSDSSGNKTVANIRFDILADDTSPLTLRKVELYDPNAVPLTPRCIEKKFSSWAMPPEHSELLQNFPNPLNPGTWIPYQLKDAGEVTIRIYNTAGELVREIDLGYKPAGLYISPDRAAHWDGTSKFGTPVASGVYFYSIQAGDLVAVRKLIVLK